MNISSIGIMQGRVIPKFIDQLQVFPNNTWNEEIDTIKDIGFDHIELLWDKKKGIKNADGILDYLSSAKLPTHSICLDSICSKSSLNDIINEILDVINTFGINTPSILVIPLLGQARINSYDKLRNFIIKLNRHQVMKMIKKYKIKLALEIDMPAIEALDALKYNESESIGICVDSGNLWHYSDKPIEEILTFSKKIIHVHIKDKDSEGNNVILGTGIVNFDLFFKALNNINYNHIITLETKYFKNPLIEATINFKYILATLQKL